MDSRADILIFIMVRFAFTEKAAKEASIFLLALHIFSVACVMKPTTFVIAEDFLSIGARPGERRRKKRSFSTGLLQALAMLC
jgi:hypothetical protein